MSSFPAAESLRSRSTSGWSDAGTRLPGWLGEVGFRAIDEGERAYWWEDADLATQASYAADVMESAFDALTQAPGATDEQLEAGLADLRSLPDVSGAGLGWVVYKSTAVR